MNLRPILKPILVIAMLVVKIGALPYSHVYAQPLQVPEPGSKEKLSALLSAVVASVQPSDQMAVLWHIEKIDVAGAVLGEGKELPPIVYQSGNMRALLKGIRGRYEETISTYSDESRSKLMRTYDSIHVDDGEVAKRLATSSPVSARPTSQGWILHKQRLDPMQQLFPVLNLIPEMRSVSESATAGSISLDDRNPEGEYDLTLKRQNGVEILITIDSEKSFNVTRIVTYLEHERIDTEWKATLKEVSPGVWFLDEAEFARFGTDGKREVQNRVKVSEVNLAADLPDDVFTLQFPSNIGIWDDVFEDWIQQSSNLPKGVSSLADKSGIQQAVVSSDPNFSDRVARSSTHLQDMQPAKRASASFVRYIYAAIAAGLVLTGAVVLFSRLKCRSK